MYEIKPKDVEYPSALRKLGSTIYVKGDLGLLQPERLGIQLVGLTGTRRATPYGIAVSGLIGREVAENGGVLITGGALGCDYAASMAALQAGGKIIVVSGCGVDYAYPRTSTQLYEAAEDGRALIISQHEDRMYPPTRAGFPERNRIIAALSRTLFVPEAHPLSGTMQTARFAHEGGTEIIAATGSIFSDASRAIDELAGACGAKLCHSSEDLIRSVRRAVIGCVPFNELDMGQRDRVTSIDATVRRDAAREGLGLDKLIADPESEVRAAVASKGYGLDRLLDDTSGYVRYAVARQGYRPDALISDELSPIRRAVAEQGYGLDVLISDPRPGVRAAVAHQGYGLDKLLADESQKVRDAAKNALNKTGMSIEEWTRAYPEKLSPSENRQPPASAEIIDDWYLPETANEKLAKIGRRPDARYGELPNAGSAGTGPQQAKKNPSTLDEIAAMTATASAGTVSIAATLEEDRTQ